ENSRVLEWICRRLDGEDTGRATPIGVVPTADDLVLDGLDVPRETVDAALAVDLDAWRAELPGIHEYFAELGERLPDELRDELAELEQRLA
ncbi:MAG TPA: phosphoenolpyruvate carboxykinase domain-containing protein, partial [Acidimicrobiia bacterium]|nr:phosphoenolpyruvate carboxykinase domain-containing protein [Acidimicrobiia bacterium]